MELFGMTDFLNFLDRSVKIQTSSIQAYTLNQEKVWLKKATKRHNTWIYVPLGWFAQLFRLKALMPVPNYGGDQAILCEARRIEQLKQLGITTPKVLAVSKQGILLQDAALNGEVVQQLDRALANTQDSTEKLKLYQKAIDALLNVHQKGSYLSEAFARNILVNTQYDFTFIDFETDPGEKLEITSCQARDWLCFIFSTSYHFTEEELQQATQMVDIAILSNENIFQEVCRVGKVINFSRFLKPEKLGRDGRRLVKSCLFFQVLEKEKIRVGANSGSN